MNSVLKILGCLAHAADSDEPRSTSSRTSPRTRASSLFSTWPARIPRDRTTDRPESIMVASWRVATAISASLTRLENPGMVISLSDVHLATSGVTEMGR